MEPSVEWSSLSGFYTVDEADFMSQLLDNCSVPEQLYENFDMEIQSASWHGHESTIASVTDINKCSHYPENVANTNFLYSSNNFPSTSGGNCYFNDPVTNTGYVPMGFSFVDSEFSPCSFQGNENQFMNENVEELGVEVVADQNLQAHRECEVLVSEPAEEDITCNLENSVKRSRRSTEVRKNKKNVKPKKKLKSASMSNTEEDTGSGLQGLSLSNYCSENDSNASQEINEEGSSSFSSKVSKDLKSNAKPRCSRGSATDPQSIYARRRRERINGRLKILQTLVPNGTKVDISTMLEEAVEYVKFLQLQIKLLSSDDLWMYAPIAHNGMNIELGLNLTPVKQP